MVTLRVLCTLRLHLAPGSCGCSRPVPAVRGVVPTPASKLALIFVLQKTLGNLLGYVLKGDDSSETAVHPLALHPFAAHPFACGVLRTCSLARAAAGMGSKLDCATCHCESVIARHR